MTNLEVYETLERIREDLKILRSKTNKFNSKSEASKADLLDKAEETVLSIMDIVWIKDLSKQDILKLNSKYKEDRNDKI